MAPITFGFASSESVGGLCFFGALCFFGTVIGIQTSLLLIDCIE